MTPSRFEALHAQMAGRGDALLLLAHGFGCDRHIWRSVAAALQAECRTLVFDHAGCGASVSAWDPIRHAHLRGYADDLLAVLAEAGDRPAIAVGHSVGSIIVLLAALAQPHRFERLVMLAPSPRFLNDPPDYIGGFEQHDIDDLFQLMESNHFGWAQFLAPLAIGPANPVALTREFERALCSLEPNVARHFAQLAFRVDVRDQLPALKVPATLVQCTDDSLAPVEVGRWMHRHMPGSELVELPVHGHCPHVSHPGLVVDLLRSRLGG